MYENLIEEAVTDENVTRALRAVIRNGGAPGIDKMPVGQLERQVREHWESLKGKLIEGKYTPSPVKRVEIPKAGGGTRLLGIPTVMDRFVQQLLLQVLGPIFESTFSEYSYGYRPGRSAHDAVKQSQKYVREGKSWVVDFDISKFFDTMHHDILMRRIGCTIRDKRVLRLIGRYLRAGVMVHGVCVETEQGAPQGGPLSPLLANIYLTPLDEELEKRGLSFSRYADDCNIHVGSARSAERVFESIAAWIREYLRLELNQEKSGSGRPWDRKFLGFRILETGEIAVAPANIQRLQTKVRTLWDARRSGTSLELRNRWQRFVKGWWNYFRLAGARREITDLDSWIRRHMRKCFWLRWHSSRGRQRAFRRLGVPARQAKVARSSRGAWRISRHPAMHMALSNERLRQYGFLVFQDLAAE
ncbi:MAG: group II intron reverse transcriptase/maturase [Comamonadaceae bacterium]